VEANVEVSTVQEQIAALAKRYPNRGLTSLNKYLDREWIREAFRRIRKDGAVGIDGVSAEQYAKELEANPDDLVNRAKSGSYFAPPVRRAYAPKPGSKEKRPLGVLTTEDKVLQKAVLMLLEPIYEGEFYDFSYAFRPERNCHKALEAIRNSIMDMRIGWILEVDIRQFFDSLDHVKLREIIRQRVRDGVLTRLIDKWLKAGVMEAGQWKRSEEGTPQGGVISPLLSNIFLHEVLDKWFVQMIQPRLHGKGFLVRYADDFVMGFQRKEDAERVMEVLPKRFARYGLTLHMGKTRIVPFKRPGAGEDKRDKKSSQSFDFLGFTHYWAKSLKGNWVVKKKTAETRLSRALQAINEWCRKHRHDPLHEQQVGLNFKLAGHYAYFGVTGNARSLHRYRERVRRYWLKWLNRRHRVRHSLSWERFKTVHEATYPLLRPRIVHSVYRACEAVT
jgi:RNA-directed DNA polymerase